jgi:hypothetical protein
MIDRFVCVVVREEVGRVEAEVKEVRNSLNSLHNLPDFATFLTKQEFNQLDTRQNITFRYGLDISEKQCPNPWTESMIFNL